MRSIYEHALCLGVAVQRPPGILSIYRNDTLLGQFGFFQMEEEELEDAALFRTCQLTKLSCVSDALSECRAVVSFNGEDTVFNYNPRELIFEQE